jgi:hypothetical protein
MTERDPIIFDVFAAAGGATALARELGLSRAALYKWQRVPLKYLRLLTKMTGIPRHKLRPDIYGE